MRKQVMKTAHSIHRANRDCLSFSDALRMAWMTIKQDAEYIVTVSTDGGRRMYAAMSSDGAQNVRREMTVFWKERGSRVYGADVMRVSQHIAAVEVSAAAEPKRARVTARGDVRQEHGHWLRA